MGADHRLARARHLGDILDLLEPLMRPAAARMSRGMDHLQAVDALLGGLGQCLIGGVAIEDGGAPPAGGGGESHGRNRPAAGRTTAKEGSGCQKASASAEPPTRRAS